MLRIKLSPGINNGRLEQLRPIQMSYNLVNMFSAIYINIIYDGGFANIVLWHDKALVAQFTGFNSNRECALDGHERTV